MIYVICIWRTIIDKEMKESQKDKQLRMFAEKYENLDCA